MSMLHVFSSQKVVLEDRSELWEVVSTSGDRVASCGDEGTAFDLEIELNMVCTAFAERPGVTINA